MVKTYDGETYIIPKAFENEVRADERKKVLDAVFIIVTNQMIKYGTDLDFNIETQELILQMKEG